MPSAELKSDSGPASGISPDRADRIRNAWSFFVATAKHRSRFFFHALAGHKDDCPQKLLETARRVFDSFHMITPFAEGHYLYRARRCDESWCVDEEAGLLAPSPDKARAGRMNPAGVSYLYLAQSPETALAEIRPPVGANIAVAEFRLTKKLNILDLTNLQGASLPRVSEDDERARQDVIPFLNGFVKTICSPVEHDGSEHIEYVPSQIVCEYMAQGHLSGTWGRIHGICYPSTLCPGSNNVVLFPAASSDEDGFLDWVVRTQALPAMYRCVSPNFRKTN